MCLTLFHSLQYKAICRTPLQHIGYDNWRFSTFFIRVVPSSRHRNAKAHLGVLYIHTKECMLCCAWIHSYSLTTIKHFKFMQTYRQQWLTNKLPWNYVTDILDITVISSRQTLRVCVWYSSPRGWSNDDMLSAERHQWQKMYDSVPYRSKLCGQ